MRLNAVPFSNAEEAQRTLKASRRRMRRAQSSSLPEFLARVGTSRSDGSYFLEEGGGEGGSSSNESFILSAQFL